MADCPLLSENSLDRTSPLQIRKKQIFLFSNIPECFDILPGTNGGMMTI